MLLNKSPKNQTDDVDRSNGNGNGNGDGLPPRVSLSIPPSSSSRSRAASTNTQTSSATQTTHDTAVSSVTFNPHDSESGHADASAFCDSSVQSSSTSGQHGQSRARGGREPPSRTASSFCSDASLVLSRNDDSEHKAAQAQIEEKHSPPQRVMDHLKHRYQSHLTHGERSVGREGSESYGLGEDEEGKNMEEKEGERRQKKPLQNLLRPLKEHFASHADQSAVPSQSQATLSNLLQSKRQSLRPCEISFLHSVLVQGSDQEIDTACENLNDTGLFFDLFTCGSGGKHLERSESEILVEERDYKYGPDDEEGMVVADDGGAPLDEGDSFLDVGQRDDESEFAPVADDNNHEEADEEKKDSTPDGSEGEDEEGVKLAPSDEVTPTVARGRSASMFESRSVHTNSLDPTEEDVAQATADVLTTGSDAGQPTTTTTTGTATDETVSKAKRMWTKLGSAARVAALESRRTHKKNKKTNLHGSIWRAHETGLSVSTAASERSITHRRCLSAVAAGAMKIEWIADGSGDADQSAQPVLVTAPPVRIKRSTSGRLSRRAMYADSLSEMSLGRDRSLSVGSLGDVLLDSRGDHITGVHDADEDKVFRRADEDDVFRPDGTEKQQDGKPKRSSLAKEVEDLLAVTEEDDGNALNTSIESAPVPSSPDKLIPKPDFASMKPSTSVGSVRSVSFAGRHTLHEFSEESITMGGKTVGVVPAKQSLPRVKRPPTILRRSSSLNRLPPSSRRALAVETGRARLFTADSPTASMASPTSSGSNGIPPLRHAHPIRSNSVLSTGSIVSEAPSLNLHRAHPIRSESFRSTGSAISAAPSLNLHRANAIRSQSFSSVVSAAPSLNLHRANPVRSQSDLSTFSFVPSEAKRLERQSSVADSVITFGSEGSDGMLSPAGTPRANDETDTEASPAPSDEAVSRSRNVMMRAASISQGEGFEIADSSIIMEEPEDSPVKVELEKLDSIDRARQYRSMLSITEASEGVISVGESLKGMPLEDFMRTGMFRRTLSDEGFYASMASDKDLFDFAAEDDDWDLESEPEQLQDAWNVLHDDYAIGYSSVPFCILGTSADDIDSDPHVLSPPLMESLQAFFPYALSEDNFYMKFSLVRDGASLHTLLQNIRGAKNTIIAIETVEGEVFGSFQTTPWRKNWNYFGSGEAFLWRMRRSRNTPCASVIDQAQLESELDVYPWTGENSFVQLCTSNKIAIGGGTKDKEEEDDDDTKMETDGQNTTSWDMDDSPSFGFGLAIEDSLLRGSSSPCLTFGSPPLSKKHDDGSSFEILNLEVWTLTPCISVEEADKLEMSRLFLESHSGLSSRSS